MIAYRLYTVDKANRVVAPPRVITCTDDDAALIEAQKYLDGRAVEVWRDTKRIASIPADD